MNNQAGSENRNQERYFLLLALALFLVFGTGFWLLILSPNGREKSASITSDRVRSLGNFVLTNQLGQTVSQADQTNKILVVSFLFTGCSLTCPVVTRHMAEIQQLTSSQPDVRLVSFTVDPRDDTVPVLAKYGERFGTDSHRWLLLTGERNILYDLIAKSFLDQDLNDPFVYMPGNFSHTERIALVNGQGRIHFYFDGMQAGVALAVVNEIARLRK